MHEAEEVPPIAPTGLDTLKAIMEQLRDPSHGCDWDRVQTFETIAPYTIEEAYEVADAIRRRNLDDLKDELGDLQLQVVYHAQIAAEIGAFDLDDVMEAICAKMVRRHPHIFGENEVSPGWEALKAAERSGAGDQSALAGIALALPALKRAEKIQRRAARAGFDWPDPAGPRSKIDEELEEFDVAADQPDRVLELGDILFSVVNLARHHQIDPEAALRDAIARFETRFRRVEEIAGKDLNMLDIEELEMLWQDAKREMSE